MERYSLLTALEAVDGEVSKDAYQELIEDLMALASSFAGKLRVEKPQIHEGVKQLIAE